MSKSKKPIIYITCFFLVLSSVIIPYYNSKASELAIATGLASSGVGLLGLLAMSGVGMELENQQKFQDLSDDEKLRIENGLAKDFNDVALQRGMALDKVSNWLDSLKNGVLDKTSDVYSMFKDWAKDIDLKKSSTDNPALNYPVGEIPPSSCFPITITNKNNVTSTLNYSDATQTFFDSKTDRFSMVYVTFSYSGLYNGYLNIKGVTRNGNKYNVRTYSTFYYGSSGTIGGWSSSYETGLTDIVVPTNVQLLKCYGNDDIMITINGVTQSGNFIDSSSDIISYFKTNTDYLERLKGQEKEQVEVIDVTDIKNPIVESKGNSIARIDWNRGTNNNNNNDDDEQTIKGGLVPADVWYESLDDYIDGQNNAIETYDEHIADNPEDKDKYFISPSPIVNISQYYDVLPVVPVPNAGTIVNNYYTYNNYNTFNNTIYNEPYNPDLVPNIPMLVFENKFPFCIPWDVYNFVSAFYVEKEAPRIDIPFPIKGANGLDIQTVTIDLSGYEYLSTIIRVMFFVLFLVGLMILTRQLIKG